MKFKLNFFKDYNSATGKARKKPSLLKFFLLFFSIIIIAYLLYIPQEKSIIDHELKVGDIIVTEKPVGAEALLCVENLPKFRGLAGSFKGNRSFRITRVAEDEEFI